MKQYHTYYISYTDRRGHYRCHRNKDNCIKEYVKFGNALKVKNWFVSKGFENVTINEVYY